MDNPFKSVPVLPSEITPRALYESRRDFLRTAGILTAGAVLCAPELKPNTMNNNRPSINSSPS